jgi:hypothetical protein
MTKLTIKTPESYQRMPQGEFDPHRVAVSKI